MADHIARILDLAVAIQQIPAPTHHEAQRAEFVRTLFMDEGLCDVEMDAIGNVFARLKGNAGAPALVVSAHLDTVFPASVDLNVFREPGRICAPGIGDNALGVAGLIGLVWELRERHLSLPADLWLVANVCEEGLGNLLGMKAVVERFDRTPRAYLVLEGMALGQVYHRALGVCRYCITIRTRGGHSWLDYGQASAIHELTRLASSITAMELPTTPRTSLNVGTITGGTSVNTIAAEASLELDLRSEDGQILVRIGKQVEELAGAMRRKDVDVSVVIIGQRPAGELPADHPLVRQAQACLGDLGLEAQLNIGSTDANLPLSLGLPAVTIGLSTGRGGHTVHEYINTAPLEKGMEQVIRLVSALA